MKMYQELKRLISSDARRLSSRLIGAIFIATAVCSVSCIDDSVTASAGPCEAGWTLKGESCYKLTAQQLPWSGAQQDCRSMNSRLAEINNVVEQDDLSDFLNSQESEVWSAWIGLNNLQDGSQWIWGSGRPMTYSNWFDNEPNNQGGNEHCVNVWPSESSRWNDYNCSTKFLGVCQKGLCESGWTFIGQSCYKLTDEQLTWTDAQKECRSMHSLLAEVHNDGEQDDLNDFLNPPETEVWSAWIGLNNLQNEKQWIWGSGRPMTYSNWFGNEPNNQGGNEHCVNVWPRDSSRWNDYNCSTKFPGVCQKGLCDFGWTLIAHSCYKVTAEQLTWTDAQQKCRSMNSLLAEVHSDDEQGDLNDFLNSQESEVWSAWIGLNNLQDGSRWIWGSGRPVTYSNWFDNEPNNAGGNEHCVNVWPRESSRWNDYTCNTTFPAVCQKATNTVSENPTITKITPTDYSPDFTDSE